MRMTSPLALTLALGLCAALAGIQTSPAAPAHAAKKKPMKGAVKKPAAAAPTAAQLAEGKATAEGSNCNGCHSADYAGKKGFSPSIRATGVTAKYTLATWERVMDTGVTEDGGHVEKPMPVYHMPAAKSAPLYAFLKTQK